MNNTQRVAIITGGATGLGFAIAQKFIQNDFLTVIIGRKPEALANAKEALGENASCLEGDLSELKVIPELVSKVMGLYGRIDVLVNNAGVHLKKPMLEVTDEEFQQVVLINQTAVFCLSREVARIMVQQGEGSIINISSMASQYGIPLVIAYTSSKSAIEGMTRAMAVELSPRGVRVNCIAPGFIKTNMSASALDKDPERKARVLSRTPIGKLGLPEDIADAAYFLASRESKYITGTIIPVDGGNAIGF